ncbi:MAG: VanW family protein, partial [Lachnospiraceae bacterium]
ENGEVVQSMGGGICQVSTTLYNALLFSELKITQRSPHSMLVDYVEPSMDAAIAGDFLDLKFVNNTKHPIFLESILSGGYITFNIYGKETREAGRTLQFVSEIIEKKVPEGKKFEEEPDAAVGTIETASQAYTGIVAKLWKIILSNGVEVGREEVNSSVYEAVKPIVKVGSYSGDKSCNCQSKRG